MRRPNPTTNCLAAHADQFLDLVVVRAAAAVLEVLAIHANGLLNLQQKRVDCDCRIDRAEAGVHAVKRRTNVVAGERDRLGSHEARDDHGVVGGVLSEATPRQCGVEVSCVAELDHHIRLGIDEGADDEVFLDQVNLDGS